MLPSRDSGEAVNRETDGHKIVHFLILPKVKKSRLASTLAGCKYVPDTLLKESSIALVSRVYHLLRYITSCLLAFMTMRLK